MLIHLLSKNSKTIEIDSVGPVLLEKSKRARRLRISIRPFKGVRVTVPYGISFTRAEEFINSHSKWMIRHSRQMKQVEQEYQNNQKQTLQISDRQEARRILISRLNELADQYGFSFNRVFIRNQATLWGIQPELGGEDSEHRPARRRGGALHRFLRAKLLHADARGTDDRLLRQAGRPRQR